jgi:hypothetical protein
MASLPQALARAEPIRLPAEVRTRKFTKVTFESICNNRCNRNERLDSEHGTPHMLLIAGTQGLMNSLQGDGG